MKIDFSWEKNKKSLVGVITMLAVLLAVNVFGLGILAGTIVGAVVGATMYGLLLRDKNEPKQ